MKKDFVSLAEARPDLIEKWNYEKNKNITPETVSYGSEKAVWWIDYGISPVTGSQIKLEWKAKINNMTHTKYIHPSISSRRLFVGYNDLQTLCPEVAADWDYERNLGLTPDMVTCGSTKKIWWVQNVKSPIDGKVIKAKWKAAVCDRTRGSGNPYLSGKAVLKGFNDVDTLHPELSKKWNYEKNGNLKPDMITCGYSKKVWWMEFANSPVTGKMMKLEWQSTVHNMLLHNVDAQNSMRLFVGYNDLQTLCPHLATEWNYEKNGNLTPQMVTCGSTKSVWWVQYVENPNTKKQMKMEWKAVVNDRVKGSGNPYLAGKAVYDGFNDLPSTNPELAKEWNYERNGNLTPKMVSNMSNKKVWWVQHIKDEETGKSIKCEWKASIYARARGNRNPFLTSRKCESYVRKYLKENNMVFIEQKKFFDLIGLGSGQLSYDFAISNNKYELILIEYNGAQHYKPVDYFGGEERFKKQKEHDKRKRDYAKKHGYKLITIKYTHDTYESIAEYLDKELKKLGVIDDTKKEEPVNGAA